MIQNKETLKSFFETGDKPTQEQFTNLIDSFIHIDQATKVTFFNDTDIRSFISGKDSFTLKTNELAIFHRRVQNNDHDQYDGYVTYLFTKGEGTWGATKEANPITIEDFILINKSPYATEVSLGFRDETINIFEHNTLDKYLQKVRNLIPKRTIENIDIENGYLKLTTDDKPRQVVAQISIQALKRALDQVNI